MLQHPRNITELNEIREIRDGRLQRRGSGSNLLGVNGSDERRNRRIIPPILIATSTNKPVGIANGNLPMLEIATGKSFMREV